MDIENNPMFLDLVLANNHAYKSGGFILKNFEVEKESADYGAATFNLNHLRVKFRVAKITPTKTGQFVTVWKRIGAGPIMPFDVGDPFDFFVLSVRRDNDLGQFIFPKNVLGEKGVLSKGGKGGKRGFRLYAPWDVVESTQAKKTQAWQLPYFVKIHKNMDLTNLRGILSCDGLRKA